MKTMILSDNCYEGYDKKTEEWVIDSYGNLTEMGCEKIDWSDSAWEDEKDYFKEYLTKAIESHESRYGTTIKEVVLCGRMGLWNSSPIGGKVIKDLNALDLGSSIETIEVGIDEDRTVVIKGHHHDGTHNMGIYFLTDAVLKEAGYAAHYEQDGASALDYGFYEKLYEIRQPLKMSKSDLVEYGFWGLDEKSSTLSEKKESDNKNTLTGDSISLNLNNCSTNENTNDKQSSLNM